MTEEKNLKCCIVLCFVGAVLFSVGVAVPMFIVVYPTGDECLLFVSVRGEALIYGNPTGCNFIAYGHCIILLAGLLLIGYIYVFKRRRNQLKSPEKNTTFSNRTLHGSNSLIQSPGPDESVRGPILGRLTHQEVGVPIILSGLIGTGCLITAMVSISGYMISCNELQYETRRQVLGRTTLGSPIKTINMYCWSLFRDVDFHNRFHFDHYEFSGQWHGQYRGYQHGRVHEFDTKHEHLINVAYALELSVACTWMSSICWIALVFVLVYLRRVQWSRNKRDIAESLEDARIYAESLNQNPGIQFSNSEGTMTMQMKPMLPQDQISLISNNSSVLKSNHHYQQLQPVFATPAITPAPQQQFQQMIPQQQQQQQQQLINQFNPQSQPVLSAASPGSFNGQQVQYMQLSNGLLVPVGSASQPNLPTAGSPNMFYPQQQMPMQGGQMPLNLQCYQTAGAGMSQSNMNPQQLMQQQMIQQQLQLQQLQLQQQQQQLISMGADPRSQQNAAVNQSELFQGQSFSPTLQQQNFNGGEGTDGGPPLSINSRKAQKKQINLSKDAGFKCSQI